ncbi:hypothetical protein ACH5RR_025688 [Cinchona calisaya]|uniref:Uncharacterized protein n=1 Tax=Cinchona calisaya TaxID=153742 RepID=A0ABD2Z0U2_9GENT
MPAAGLKGRRDGAFEKTNRTIHTVVRDVGFTAGSHKFPAVCVEREIPVNVADTIQNLATDLNFAVATDLKSKGFEVVPHEIKRTPLLILISRGTPMLMGKNPHQFNSIEAKT